MIKVLIEEPVAIPDNETLNCIGMLEIDDYWIYKNPISSEVDSTSSVCDEIRVLIKGKDYYIAPAYIYTHSEMTKLLYGYNKLTYNNYDVSLIISMYDNTLQVGSLNTKNQESALDFVKEIYYDMESSGLINVDTSIIDGYNSTNEYSGRFLGELFDIE